nr:hypothetical protein [uncultured Oscillibacter sp.]
MKKIRKLTSLLLVLVMSLALAVPCFAASPKQGDAVILEIGESYTDPESGLTFSLKPWAGFSQAEKTALMNGTALPTPRGGVHYYSRGVDIRSDSYSAPYTAQARYGNVFAAAIDTSPTKNLSGNDYTYVEIEATDMHRSCFGRIPKGEATVFEISGGASDFSGRVTMTIERNPEFWVWYDVYQYAE